MSRLAPPPIDRDTPVPEQEKEEEALIRERLAVFRSFVEANLGRGYTQMPNEIRCDPTLSRAAKDVYEHLLSYMWKGDICCWPSQKTIAAALGKGCSVRTVIRAIQELYERCYIEKQRRGLGLTNRYFINPLSFVLSFRRPGRGHGKEALLTVGSAELMTHVTTTPLQDVVPINILLSGICQNDTSTDAKMAHQNVPFWQTIQTQSSETKRRESVGETDSRSGTAARSLGGEVPESPACSHIEHRAIRKEQKDEEKSRDVTRQNEKTEESRNSNGTEKNPPARAKDVESENKPKRRKHERGEVPPALPTYLTAQLRSISTFFCDQAPRSSETTLAWIFADVAQRGMSEYDFVDFIGQAEKVTRAVTPTIKKLNTDGSVAQMPYFLATLERNVLAWCDKVDQALAQAPHTLHAEDQMPAAGPAEPSSAPDLEGRRGDPARGPEATLELHSPTEEIQRPAQRLVAAPCAPEPSEEAYQGQVLETGDPGDGWATQEGANCRAEWLRDELDPLHVIYTWMVLPTVYGRWGFEFRLRTGQVVEKICLSNRDIGACRARLYAQL